MSEVHLVGEPLRRIEDAALLAGRGRYAGDIVLPGMLHAHFLRSPIAHRRSPGRRYPG